MAAVDLARLPEESTGSHIGRLQNALGKFHTNLVSCKSENEELRAAVAAAEDDLLLLQAHAEEAKKLNPIVVVVLTQIVVAASAGLEEAYAEGKPYIALPTLVVSGILAGIAYVTGNGRTGDGLVAILNGAASVLNTRYSSKKGAEHAAKRRARAPEGAQRAAEEKEE